MNHKAVEGLRNNATVKGETVTSLTNLGRTCSFLRLDEHKL